MAFVVIYLIKGASIIRMMRFFLGEETFKRGLTRYLNELKYGAAFHDHLWFALGNQSKIENKARHDVKEIMDTWTLQMNYPVVIITKDSATRIRIQQKRYLRDPEAVDPGTYISPFQVECQLIAQGSSALTIPKVKCNVFSTRKFCIDFFKRKMSIDSKRVECQLIAQGSSALTFPRVKCQAYSIRVECQLIAQGSSALTIPKVKCNVFSTRKFCIDFFKRKMSIDSKRVECQLIAQGSSALTFRRVKCQAYSIRVECQLIAQGSSALTFPRVKCQAYSIRVKCQRRAQGKSALTFPPVKCKAYSTRYRWEIPFTYTTSGAPNFNQSDADIVWLNRSTESRKYQYKNRMSIMIMGLKSF
ncbi:hypothetical protein KUTeg_002848 [Tegillarca granosa]|uniref:Peptidase M1 membrane alanine aminopeptidase domain-containing protein n=1 Tax=Tegillarca granosa TaxID=220873 RepID=A0ABQ9FQM4_TEGGR|nr:hypothetical protein KUTeg_002848 [Tegillarca granosa]